MGVELRDGVRVLWLERSRLVLRRGRGSPEHLARRRLVEANRGIREPDRLEQPHDAHARVFRSQGRLLPGLGNEARAREVVDLLRLGALDRREQGELIDQVAAEQRDAVDDMRDPLGDLGRGLPDEPEDLIPLREQPFGQVRPVLTADSHDEHTASCHGGSIAETNDGLGSLGRRVVNTPQLINLGPALVCALSWYGAGAVVPKRLLAQDALLRATTRVALGMTVVAVGLYLIGRAGVFEQWFVAAITVALVLDLVAATAPPSSADALKYHLAVPDLWLDAGRVTDVFWQWTAFNPFAIELL